MKRVAKAAIAGVIVMALGLGYIGTIADVADTEAGDKSFMVHEAPKNFSVAARQLGFTDIEIVELGELSLIVYQVSVPNGQTVEAAMDRIRRAFPKAQVEQGVDETSSF